MSQININDDDPRYRNEDSGRGAAVNNLTWAIAMVLVIAAVAIAIVYVVHSVHVF